MFDIYFVVFLFSFCVFCFLEILVFNDELLLVFCFFSFIFFCINSVSSSVFGTFDANANKIESDLLVSFFGSKQLACGQFDECSKFRRCFFWFSSLSISLSYWSFTNRNLLINSSEFTFLFKDLVFEKFTLLTQLERLSTRFSKKNFVFNSLFPLIFTKITNASTQVCKRLKSYNLIGNN